MQRITEDQVRNLKKVGPHKAIAVNLDYEATALGPPIGLFGIITEDLTMHEFEINERAARVMLVSLLNYIALIEGKPIPYPTPAGPAGAS